MKTFIYGQLIKQRREEKGLTLTALADASGLTLENITRIEAGELGEFFNTSNMHDICKVLNLDFGALLNETLEEKKTPVELIEFLEPGGLGTLEQRAVRLFIHEQISQGRACEILGRHSWDIPLDLESTGCTCPGCREYIERCKAFKSGELD